MSSEETEKKIREVFEETMKKYEEDHKEKIRKIDRDYRIFLILIGVVVLVFTLVPVFIKLWRG